jgi:hypothetical protein
MRRLRLLFCLSTPFALLLASSLSRYMGSGFRVIRSLQLSYPWSGKSRAASTAAATGPMSFPPSEAQTMHAVSWQCPSLSVAERSWTSCIVSDPRGCPRCHQWGKRDGCCRPSQRALPVVPAKLELRPNGATSVADAHTVSGSQCIAMSVLPRNPRNSRPSHPPCSNH